VLYLMMERKLHWNTVNSIARADLFYPDGHRPDLAAAMPYGARHANCGDPQRRRTASPVRRGRQPAATCPAHDTYGELRVSEVVNFDRATSTVNPYDACVDGKRAKGRYTLPPSAFWRNCARTGGVSAQTWLFPAPHPENHLDSNRAREVFTRPRSRPASQGR